MGQNLIVDWYTGEGRVERYGQLARDVVRLKPDLVFAITTAIAQNLKAATTTIPLVGIVVDPIGFGLVNTWRGPAAISPASVWMRGSKFGGNVSNS